MAVYSGPEIVNNGLVFVADVGNIKSYSGSGDTWKDIQQDVTSTGTSVPSFFNNPDWSSNVTHLTVTSVVSVLGYDTGYAYHPISKWVGTTDATFVLYHFQNFQSNNSQNRFMWYGNRGGVWSSLSNSYTGSPGNTYMFTLQYNSTTGGQGWVNNNKISGRVGSGVLGTSTASIRIDGGPLARSGIHNTLAAWIYDRELTDQEIQQNFEATRSRYGI